MKSAVVVLACLLFSGCMHNRDLPAAQSLSGETVRMGCLNRTAEGGYVLADAKTGERIAVTGNPVLQFHSGNHAVRVVGMLGTESGGAGIHAVQVEHIAGACQAPFPK